MIGIYKITNKINGKCYIGQSVDIERRFTEHRCPHGTVSSIKLAILKYGKDNFTYEVIEECSVSELDSREIFWIAHLKPEYNRNAGGIGNKSHYISDDLKKHLSQKNKEYWENLSDNKKSEICSRLTGHPKGHTVSAATREKLRQSNLGKRQSEETILKRKKTMMLKKSQGYVQNNSGHMKKILCIDDNIIFNSVKSAGEYYSVTPSIISGVLKGRYKSCKGKRFTYVV